MNHPVVTVSEFTEKMALLRSAMDEGLEDEYHVSLHVTSVPVSWREVWNGSSSLLHVFGGMASAEIFRGFSDLLTHDCEVQLVSFQDFQ